MYPAQVDAAGRRGTSPPNGPDRTVRTERFGLSPLPDSIYTAGWGSHAGRRSFVSGELRLRSGNFIIFSAEPDSPSAAGMDGTIYQEGL